MLPGLPSIRAPPLGSGLVAEHLPEPGSNPAGLGGLRQGREYGVVGEILGVTGRHEALRQGPQAPGVLGKLRAEVDVWLRHHLPRCRRPQQ